MEISVNSQKMSVPIYVAPLEMNSITSNSSCTADTVVLRHIKFTFYGIGVALSLYMVFSAQNLWPHLSRSILVSAMFAAVLGTGSFAVAQTVATAERTKSWSELMREPTPLQEYSFERIESVAVGVASPSNGSGSLGHMFIVFYPENKNFNEAIAYEYAPESRDTGANLFANTKLIMDRMLAREKADEYLYQDRPTSLVHLDLSPSQAKQLITQMDVDFLWYSTADKNKDYNVLSNNCLTLVYEHINSVLTAEQKPLPYFKNHGTLGKALQYILPHKLTENAPFTSHKRLVGHSLTRDHEIIEPEIIQEAPIYSYMVSHLTTFLEECSPKYKGQKDLRLSFKTLGFDINTKNSAVTFAQRTLSQREIRESRSFLQFLKNQREHCAADKEKATALYSTMLDLIGFLTNDFSTISRLREFSQ